MSSVLTLVSNLVPALWDLLDTTAPAMHMEMAEAYYGIDATDESILSDTQRMILVYGTGLSMVVAGLDMVRTELQKAKAGPATAEWVDKLKAFLELQGWLKKRLDALIMGVDPYLPPAILTKVQ